MNDLFNKWTMLILGIWFFNALGCLFGGKNKNTNFGYALVATVLIGV